MGIRSCAQDSRDFIHVTVYWCLRVVLPCTIVVAAIGLLMVCSFPKGDVHDLGAIIALCAQFLCIPVDIFCFYHHEALKSGWGRWLIVAWGVATMLLAFTSYALLNLKFGTIFQWLTALSPQLYLNIYPVIFLSMRSPPASAEVVPA